VDICYQSKFFREVTVVVYMGLCCIWSGWLVLGELGDVSFGHEREWKVGWGGVAV
jgi:hypothetical protein